MDTHDLYELCVQSPAHLVPMIRAIHAHRPTILAEDFAGTAALSRVWCDTDPAAAAIATDLDAAALARATHPRITTIRRDLRDPAPATHPGPPPADAIFVGNFSIGYLHTRAQLLAYLRTAAARLTERGLFLCDTYGGASAFTRGVVERPHPIPPGRFPDAPPNARILYAWEQREADPLTAMVTNVLHFRLEHRDGTHAEILREWPEAFTYHWRLWSVPELRDAMAEAGLTATQVYSTLPDAVDGEGNAYVEPIDPEDLGDSFIVLIAARTA